MTATAFDRERNQIKATLTNPHRLCAQLGLLDGAQRQTGGLHIRCPAHRDNTPSCSVRVGPDGTLACHCFGCGFGGDVFALIAAAEGLTLPRDFAAVRTRAAELANLDPTAPANQERAARPIAAGPPAYPDAGEVATLWSRAETITSAPEASAYLQGRAIDVEACERFDLARVLPANAPCPKWARWRGVAWSTAGYRLVVPVCDHTGTTRSLRAWRWAVADHTPKRIAPADKATVGLVMACPTARRMLAGALPPRPLDVVITEGEPDFLTHASAVSEASDTPPAVLGVVSAAWAEALAERIPDSARVYIRTHDDDAGARYARTIIATLAARVRAGAVTLYDRPRTPR